MNEFDKFIQSTKSPSKTDLLKLFKETFSVGMEEFAKTIGHMFNAPNKAGKHQISRNLGEWEEQLIEDRKTVF